MRIKVARYTQNNPAPLVIEPLLTTEPVMTERGRNELDEHQFPRNVHTLTLTLDKDILPGQMVEVYEANETWRGKVLSVNINIGRPKISQTLKIERIIQ